MELDLPPASNPPDADWLTLLANILEEKELIPAGLDNNALLQALDRTIAASSMIARHQPIPHNTPTLLIKALVNPAPEPYYSIWRNLSSAYDEVGIDVSHGILCAPSSSESLAQLIRTFIAKKLGE